MPDHTGSLCCFISRGTAFLFTIVTPFTTPDRITDAYPGVPVVDAVGGHSPHRRPRPPEFLPSDATKADFRYLMPPRDVTIRWRRLP